MQSHPIIPSPVDFGWDQNDEGDLTISWNKVNPAPDEVLEMMFCTCLKKCVRGSCPCVDNSLKCTDACTNHECDNFQSNEEPAEEYEIDYEDDNDECEYETDESDDEESDIDMEVSEDDNFDDDKDLFC